MALDESKIRALLEKADPSMKKRRLEEDLAAYQEQLLIATRNHTSQSKLTDAREAERDNVPELALPTFDRQQAEAEMTIQMMEVQINAFVEEIENTMEAIEQINQAGIVAKPGNRRSRRGG